MNYINSQLNYILNKYILQKYYTKFPLRFYCQSKIYVIGSDFILSCFSSICKTKRLFYLINIYKLF